MENKKYYIVVLHYPYEGDCFDNTAFVFDDSKEATKYKNEMNKKLKKNNDSGFYSKIEIPLWKKLV